MKVVNLRKEKYTHYIGRGSVFGNPFKIGINGTREEVVKKYSGCLYGHNFYNICGSEQLAKLRKAIYGLPKNAILGCYCKPKLCHGDVIIKAWKEMHRK